ncbi:MAG: acyl-CoA dehydrogenase [Planctomycetota bacterium]
MILFLIYLLLFAALAGCFLFAGRAFLAWVVPTALAFLGWWFSTPTMALFVPALCLFVAAVIFVGSPFLRRRFVTGTVMKKLGAAMPTMSETERVALEAGSVWWDGELFSGKPNWKSVFDFQVQPLNAEERAFLDGPVEELCAMLDDFQIQQDQDLPPEVWSFLKEHRFFGMIIPKEHGGLGFSGAAHSAVVTRLSSASVAASVTVMVPNSLGPAELLLHYGTDEQKEYYLHRLAAGEEIPCFALTEPNAGSDAASISSNGIVCHGTFDGKDVVGIRLNWNKRYITLSPIATVLGLAFQLRDPEAILGDQEDLGITCALIPHDLPGVELGKRHDPLQIPFLNGPTVGEDVFIPLDFIIGGQAQAGKGWLMLMQCLAAGRGISLPSLSTGAAQIATRTVGTYGNIREQFNVPIGAFEGIDERIARIAGLTYSMNATRVLSAAAVDAGHKPAVISAIAKHYMTELMRVTINDAMDVQAGAAICRGPRNVLAGAYSAIPVGITVEGANILTRTLIIYGQGAIRCHPYIQEQMAAIAENDLRRFDRAFFCHAGFTTSNLFRAFVYGMTNGRPLRSSETGLPATYLAQLQRYSAAFVTLSDVAMGVLGGALKRKEKISGRFADALGWMYLCTATLKHFRDCGSKKAEEPLLQWSCEYGLYQVEQALLGVLDNFPVRPLAWGLRRLCFPLGARRRLPSDRLGSQVSRAVLSDKELLESLSGDIYMPPADRAGLGALNAAADKARAALLVKKIVSDAVRAKKLDKQPRATLYTRALEADVITRDELATIEAANEARNDAVQVDAFGAPREQRTGVHATS